jgi:excinuclease UvrABC ATPase subunit
VRARGFVIGHTPVLPGRVATRFGGRVVQIDGGMLGGEFFPKGTPVALEVKGTEMTAIYLDRRERVETPALTASAASR